jgi:hypothetical protein
MRSGEALAEVLAILRSDELVAYTHLVDALDGLIVNCAVGGEQFHVLHAGDLVIRAGHHATAQALVHTDRATILALIDGDLRLLDSVMTGRLGLLADVSLMVRISRAQRAFAEGAARARRVRPLLARYREADSEFA